MQNLTVNINQIKELILQIDSNERIELAKFIDKLTLKQRFEKILDLLEKVPLTFEEITSEVERVREAMCSYRSK
ncbi:MAG: hypothetical protein KJ666_07820 [Bacteroidetes bacterium]|nr:hypothetical protein [Bacteroidota bacterium]